MSDETVHGEGWLVRAAESERHAALSDSRIWHDFFVEGERTYYLYALPIDPLWLRLLRLLTIP